MTTPNDGGPAFPVLYDDLDHGMSLRDWFAGQALNGIISCNPKPIDNVEQAAKAAYVFADAPLAKRERK